jgi:hypothetical protein
MVTVTVTVTAALSLIYSKDIWWIRNYYLHK